LKRHRPSQRELLITLIAFVIIGFYAVAHRDQRAKAVVTAPVIVGDIESAVLATGTIVPYRLVSIGAQASGQIKSLKVKLGDNVKAGDLIAEIDATTELNSLKNAHAALDSLRAQRDVQNALRKQAALAFERQKILLRQDAGSRAEYEGAEATLAVTRAQLASLNAQILQGATTLDTAVATLQYTKIRAPINGTVIAIVAQEGQTVSANQTIPTIVKLAQLDTVTVNADVSEADVTQVRPGQKVYFTILGNPQKRYESRLRSVAPAPQSLEADSTGGGRESSGSSAGNAVYYSALLDVVNSDGILRVSMTAEVRIVVAEDHAVLIIPSAALRDKDGSYFVTVLNDRGRGTLRSVQIGINNHVSAEVREGLKLGERVVISDGGP
jgi:macrolide-specific efflux system membrane fusion protein